MKKPCHYCNGTGVDQPFAIRCMCCSTPIKALREAREPCPNCPLMAHTLSIGDLIELGHKFTQKELRTCLGTDWKVEAKRIKTEARQRPRKRNDRPSRVGRS